MLFGVYMRLILAADLHLTDLFPQEIQADQDHAVDFIVKLARTKGCTHIAFLGDTIHDKKLIYISALRKLELLISENQDLTFLFLIGNHDCVGTPENHGFGTFTKYENVRIIDELSEVNLDGRTLAFLPYSKNMHEMLPRITADILFGHFGLNEAQVSPGISTSHQIKLSDLIPFKRVFTGHFHLPQTLEYGDNSEVWYVGSTNARDWNDKNQEKRVLVYDTAEDAVESVPITGTTRFYELEINDISEADGVFKHRDELKEQGHRVRIRSSVVLSADNENLVILASQEAESLDTETLTADELISEWSTTHAHDLDVTITADDLNVYGLSLLTQAKERIEAVNTAENTEDDD
jgi:hypothetical protein